MVETQPLEGAGRCQHCDEIGGEITYRNQVSMPLNGRVRCIDYCIHRIIAALNAGGIKTRWCCCGHGQMPGRIDLEDGRTLAVLSPDDLQRVWQSGEQWAQPSTEV